MPSMESSSSDAELQQQPQQQQQQQQQQHQHLERNDDFLDQMLSSISSWPELPPQQQQQQVNPKFPWDGSSGTDQQINRQILMPRAETTTLMPLTLGGTDHSDAAIIDRTREESIGLVAADGSVGYGIGHRPMGNPQRFSAPQHNYGATSAVSNSATSSGATSGGGAPPRQKVRARRGQATDPHSIAERLRRERIAERMKALQELVPNANKTDKASMLDEIIDYVKFLQLQVKVLSMSRLGGAAAVAPLMANMASERTASGAKESNMQQGSSAAVSGSCSGSGGGGGGGGVGMTEHQVAKLMEEDMGSAMQYLQGKGLCLMPISLASAISTVTGGSHSKPPTAARYNLQQAGDGGNVFSRGGQQSHPSGTVKAGGPSKSVAADGASPTTKDASSTSKSDA